MNVLILGGTGAIGSHLVRLLAEAGHEVTTTTRKFIPDHGRIRYRQGDAQNTDFLRQVLQTGWDVIVDFMVYTTPQFVERVNWLLKSTGHYLFISSARVYADSSLPIIESSPRLLDVSQDVDYLRTDEYALTKARQEDVLLQSRTNNWTIIRPYITYGDARLQLGVLEKEEWLYRTLKGRSIVFPRELLDKRTTMTYAEDVSRAIAALVGTSSARGEAFHVTASESLTWYDVLEVYSKVFQSWMARPVKIKLVELDRFLEIRPSRYQVTFDRMYHRTFNNAKIAEFVDLGTFAKPEPQLEICLTKFLEHVTFGELNWQTEARLDREVGQQADLSEIHGFRPRFRYLKARYL